MAVAAASVRWRKLGHARGSQGGPGGCRGESGQNFGVLGVGHGGLSSASSGV